MAAWTAVAAVPMPYFASPGLQPGGRSKLKSASWPTWLSSQAPRLRQRRVMPCSGSRWQCGPIVEHVLAELYDLGASHNTTNPTQLCHPVTAQLHTWVLSGVAGV